MSWVLQKQVLRENNANVLISYQNDRLKERVLKLADELNIGNSYQCDLSVDQDIATLRDNIRQDCGNLDGIVHSAAFAPKDHLSGKYLDNISRDGFALAHDISSYSFTALAKAFKDDLNEAASLVTLSYIGSNRVVQNYNVMGVAKASLERKQR